jgi:hypothetical protein
VSLRMSYLLYIVGNMLTIAGNQSLPASTVDSWAEASPSLPESRRGAISVVDWKWSA